MEAQDAPQPAQEAPQPAQEAQSAQDAQPAPQGGEVQHVLRRMARLVRAEIAPFPRPIELHAYPATCR